MTIPYLKSNSNSPGASDLMAFVIQHRRWIIMMTSSNENIFCVTGPLRGEFTGCQGIPLTKVSDAELWCFLWLRLNKQLSKQSGRRWFDMQWHSIWCHSNDGLISEVTLYDAAPEWGAAIESILHTQDIVVKQSNVSLVSYECWNYHPHKYKNWLLRRRLYTCLYVFISYYHEWLGTNKN